MRTIIRSVALGLAFGLSFSCAHQDSGEKKPSAEAVKNTGRLDLALQAVSDSGKVYRLRQATFPIFAFSGSSTSTQLNSEDDVSLSVLEKFLAPGSYEIFLQDGWFIEQVDNLNGNAFPVAATLLTPQFQVFDIVSDQEKFLQFDFQVDGTRVTFGPPGRLIVGIDVHEREAGAPSGINVRRSLLETGQTAVSAFTLSSVLQAIQVNSGVSPNPNLLYRQIIDSYASAANGKEPTAFHCGDETTNGTPTLNGFPIQCDRLEAQQIDNLDKWFATAAVNRLDLAPADGSHCGQQRLVFANNQFIGNGRMFMILEAQIPNPHPECGVAACRPLADFWAKQSDISDAGERGKRLARAYLSGDPDLASADFPPFINVANLSVGTGSIRTNNFDDFEWTLRRFKVMTNPEGSTRAIPFPVADAPHGELWDDNSQLPAAAGCRQSFKTALQSLLSDDPAEMAFPVDDSCYDSESPNDFFTENYPQHLANGNGTFRSELAGVLAGTGLTPEDIAARAQFAGSCIGCHEEANGLSLGRGVIGPNSNGFVHIDEEFTENCGDGTQCFTASPALKQVFLPRRLRSLNDVLNGATACGGGPALPDGGVVTPPPVNVDSGTAPPPPPPAADAGAPPSTVLTPDKSLGDLVDEDEKAHDKLAGQTTLGGQPAGVTH
jgi:hypothetical protein